MTRLPRPPSVEDYARMSEAARLTAAQVAEARRILAAESLAAIQRRRAQLRNIAPLVDRPYTPPPPHALRADEYSADDTRRAAALLVRLAARRWPEPDAVKAERRAILAAETEPRRVAA